MADTRSEPEPVSAQPLSADDGSPTEWADARGRLEGAMLYWLATVRPDGRPHVMPLLGVWVDGALHFVAGATTRKARNLERESHRVITADSQGLHLVLEGEAATVRDEEELHRVAGVYASKYDWQVAVRDGAFYAEGAPTAGPPPYEVYKFTPSTIFAFSEDGSLSAMRWRFK